MFGVPISIVRLLAKKPVKTLLAFADVSRTALILWGMIDRCTSSNLSYIFRRF